MDTHTTAPRPAVFRDVPLPVRDSRELVLLVTHIVAMEINRNKKKQVLICSVGSTALSDTMESRNEQGQAQKKTEHKKKREKYK